MLYISIGIIVTFVILGFIYPENLAFTADQMLKATVKNFGWFYVLATFFFVIFALFLAFSRYGRIRLGSDDDRPEYSNITWFGMLFSAGMGIGLVFWGVAEPLLHYINPPMGITGETAEAARISMRYTFLHWGLHPWAIYTIIALSLAYFRFRKGYSGLISSTFYPLFGEKTKGITGKLIDILAIIATAFGVATSLGLGTLQINGGLSQLFNIPANTKTYLIIIAIVTILYMISAISGLNKGIKILSNVNVLIAVLLLLFVFIAGPTLFILDTFVLSLGGYLQNFINLSLRLAPFTSSEWLSNWTIFYWAWWIAWAPFVGMFIARVSKGRTIKQFVLGVMLIPALISLFWFAVFGGTGLNLQIFHHIELAQTAQNDVASALFITLTHLPLESIISSLATILLITFFVTSADSATFVLGMLSTNGNLHPPNRIKFIWGILQSSIAAVLLLSGGLQGLRSASIVIALPFTAIMVLMVFSTYKSLKLEGKPPKDINTKGKSKFV